MIIFQNLVNLGKRFHNKKALGLFSSGCKCLFVRKRSDVAKKFVTFDEVVAQRRAEAKRSLVVQVNSEASFTELYGYCSKYASISGVHHYKNSGGEHFMLIEFSTDESLKDVVRACATHQKDIDIMAQQSPFLWFRASTDKKEKFKLPDGLSLVTQNGDMEVNEDLLFEKLVQCKTVSEQIQVLYDQTVLNDLGVRLRYMVARQIECIFESMYANIAVLPFGSSVNGFGKLGCDLDLVLTNSLTSEMKSPQKRLVYQEKRCGEGRGAWQRHLELVAEGVEARAAGVSRVTRVLHAAVPIVKFRHQLAAVDVDLCFNNMSGVQMCWLAVALRGLAASAAPLALCVRRWARAAALTSHHPGRWITNFPLTLLVLFFLQQPNANLLPPLNALLKSTGQDDRRIAEDNLNYTFLRNLKKLPKEYYGQNKSSLETLLLQFFEFYAQFDFQNKAISINEGTAVRKPNNLPMYIINPLDQALNVSKNVSYEECERFKVEVRNAAWLLESTENQTSDDWGIIPLIERKTTRGLKKLLKVGNSHRLLSVKDLFEEEEKIPDEGSTKKAERLIQKTASEDSAKVVINSEKEKKGAIKFKNSQVASEVYRIQRDKMV